MEAFFYPNVIDVTQQNTEGSRMKINLLAAFSLGLFSMVASANIAIVPLNSSRNGMNIKSISQTEIVMDLSIDTIKLKDVRLGGKMFVEIESSLLTKTFGRGTPNLPVFTKLVQVPAGMKATIETSDHDTEEINLSDYNVSNQVVPSQESISKSAKKIPFFFDSAAYKSSGFSGQAIATIDNLGTMRNIKLAQLKISPFQYDASSGKLQIRNNIRAVIKFEANPLVAELSNQYDADNFTELLNGVIGAQHPLFARADAPTYIIVSARKFENDLQRFVAWKQDSGYQVIQAYTDMPEVGATKATIKDYLNKLFLSPPAGFNPQQFILFVGDVAEIPTFDGLTGTHVTDLPYAEYTGDIFPDAFYGRFSASTSSDLNAIIDKTLAYETRSLPDMSYLSRVTMVAGSDSSYQNWSNGQINYGVTNYFNATNGITSNTLLQPEVSGAQYSTKIKSDVNQGIGYANYTAHCSEDGWADPSFKLSDIPKLANTDRYGVWVGNCCLSAAFNKTSFAEAAVRLAKKGAVGYIGASDYSYWDEDYWWAVGFKEINPHPDYNSASVGVYDQLFTKSTSISKLSQIIFAGNLAVQASTSSRKNYYWEVYNVMGDPSLDIQFK